MTGTAYYIHCEDIAQKLDDFGERTEEVMIDIANETTVPDYEKLSIIVRQDLGERAIKLAQEIREAAEKSAAPLPDPESVDVDSAISNILGEESSK